MLLPLVRALYGTEPQFLWRDDEGQEHIITQGEGGEQGDPLMPALYALAQHAALAEASGRLHPDDWLFAFLDDLYVVSNRDRAKWAYETVAHEVERQAGVRTHLGKLQAWSAGGCDAPRGLEGLRSDGTPVWTGNLDGADNGVTCVGTPVCHAEYVRAHGRERMAK